MFRTSSIVVLSFFSLLANANSVDSWLDKMGQSMKQQSYQGTLVVRQGDELRAIKVTQGVNAGNSWQTLESQTGEKHIIVRKNAEVTTIYPAKKLVTISAAMRDGTSKGLVHSLPQNREKLKQLYVFELGGEARVADKITQIIHMNSRDKYRYGYTFWLDKQSGLLLKCDLKNNQGQVLEQLMFSNIELLSSSPKNHIEISKLQAFKQVKLSDTKDMDTQNWHADKVPAGFALIRSVKTIQQPATYHMVFSDGMASVSVFIVPLNQKQQMHVGESNMGLVNAYSALNKDMFVTAIGEVPPLTVRMIAQSIQLVH